MKQISKISLVGYLAGAIFIIISSVRYYILYPDLDRFLAYLTIGVLIISVAWLYSKQKSQGNTLDMLEDYIQNQIEENNKKENAVEKEVIGKPQNE
jgi:hypothetical protein